MKRIWTIIGVDNVPGSFKWYQTLLGLPVSSPAHEHFGQIVDSDGTVLLCLHQWGAHEHPPLMEPAATSAGNGLLQFFRVDDYNDALKRARALVPRLEEEPHTNPNTQTKEFSLRGPDGSWTSHFEGKAFQARRSLVHFYSTQGGLVFSIVLISLPAVYWACYRALQLLHLIG